MGETVQEKSIYRALTLDGEGQRHRLGSLGENETGLVTMTWFEFDLI